MVYLIMDKKAGKCKIGYSSNVEGRLANLQTSNHNYLEIAGWKEGGKQLEAELHIRFEKYRIKGEWFNYTDEIREYFSAEPEHVMINARKISELSKLSFVVIPYFLLIASTCDYNNIVSLRGEDKKELNKRYDINIGTLHKVIAELVRIKALSRLGYGKYSINQEYATRG